jgi:hypothetical protein
VYAWDNNRFLGDYRVITEDIETLEVEFNHTIGAYVNYVITKQKVKIFVVL